MYVKRAKYAVTLQNKFIQMFIYEKSWCIIMGPPLAEGRGLGPLESPPFAQACSHSRDAEPLSEPYWS